MSAPYASQDPRYRHSYDREAGAALLHKLRTEGRFSFVDLEAVTGIRRENLCAIENGRRPLGPKTARLLGFALHVDYRDFL